MLSKLSLDNPEKRNQSWMDTLVTDIVKNGLRLIFKQEWDSRYHSTLGLWDDTTKSGTQLLNKERKIPNDYKSKLATGNTSCWDCSAFFYAILKSNSIGNAHLNSTVRSEVNNLRLIRNQVKHASEGNLSETDFQALVAKVENSFKLLGISSAEITQLKAEKSLYTSFQIFPAKPTHDTVSRTDLISKISKDLQELYTSNNQQLTYLYISGNPGSGKSELARQVSEYFYSNEITNGTEMSFVMTINASDLGSLMNSYVAWCRRLNCDEKKLKNITSTSKTKEDKISELKNLAASSVRYWKRWLLIVDNVEDLAKVSQLLPKLGESDWENGQIIVTTQDSSCIPLDGQFTKHVSISAGMNKQECRKLLNSLSQSNFDDEQLDDVAKRLDRQPLAMAAAAVYLILVIQTSPQFSWHDYLKKLEDGKRHITERELGKKNHAYSNTMSAAVFLAVKKSADNTILYHAFHFLALLSFDPLPIEIIFSFIEDMDPTVDREEIGLNISHCSLFLPVEDKSYSIRVHRVVHEALKKFCDSNENEEDIPVAPVAEKKRKENVFEKWYRVTRSLSRFEDRDDKIKLIPHLNAFHLELRRLCPKTATLLPVKANTKDEISNSFLFFGKALRDFCEYELALEFLQAIFQIWKDSEQQSFVAVTYNEQGKLHRVLGELQEAKENFEQALKILLVTAGPDDASVAESYNKIGSVYRCLGELQQSKDYYERAHKILDNQFGPNTIQVATSYNSIGVLMHDLGELEEAKDYLMKALTIRVKELGNNHVDVASSYHNLGALHHELGDLVKAKDYYQLALNIRMELLGPNHANIATSYDRFGALHHDLGEFDLAIQYHERALDIRTKLFGEIHVNVASSCDSLGNLHYNMGKLQLAKNYLERSLNIRVKKLGEDHVHVASTRNNLGLVHHDLHDEDKAKQCIETALRIREKQLGPNHFALASSYYNLGKLHNDSGDLHQAEKYHQDALRIRFKRLGADHFLTANSYEALAYIYEVNGDLKKAIEHHEHALNIRTKRFQPNHFAIIRSYKRLGLVYKKMGNHKKAEECHQRFAAVEMS